MSKPAQAPKAPTGRVEYQTPTGPAIGTVNEVRTNARGTDTVEIETADGSTTLRFASTVKPA
jgi:hypothetical protein